MPTVVIGNSRELSSCVMSQMHDFRYDVFVKRLGWSLPMLHGLEKDQYDTPEAKYVLLHNNEGRITACARLLATTSAYMLPELFPQLLGDEQTPRDAGVWELSRFATSVRQTREGRILTLSQPTLDFLGLILDFARGRAIEQLVLVTSVGIERLLLRAGVPVHRLAPPAIIDGSLHVALFIEVNASTPASSSQRCIV
ncbi:MAG TPA: acyl-homoserine-lactone synthase [Steroidobacteraceae bacterium]|nr:acyl-homoserine-lactone synthase [Steroidobacteraceae bacterium]